MILRSSGGHNVCRREQPRVCQQGPLSCWNGRSRSQDGKVAHQKKAVSRDKCAEDDGIKPQLFYGGEIGWLLVGVDQKCGAIKNASAGEPARRDKVQPSRVGSCSRGGRKATETGYNNLGLVLLRRGRRRGCRGRTVNGPSKAWAYPGKIQLPRAEWCRATVWSNCRPFLIR